MYRLRVNGIGMRTLDFFLFALQIFRTDFVELLVLVLAKGRNTDGTDEADKDGFFICCAKSKLQTIVENRHLELDTGLG